MQPYSECYNYFCDCIIKYMFNKMKQCNFLIMKNMKMVAFIMTMWELRLIFFFDENHISHIIDLFTNNKLNLHSVLFNNIHNLVDVLLEQNACDQLFKFTMSNCDTKSSITNQRC